jgi:hypothetical protein
MRGKSLSRVTNRQILPSTFSERPEMIFSQGEVTESQNKKRKLVYEKPKHYVHKKRSEDVEGGALQVGSGAGGSCIDYASLPAARSSL